MDLNTIVNSGLARIEQKARDICLINSQLDNHLSFELFSPDFWQQRDAITGTAQGRGTTYFIKHDNNQWVLRHYYRGGLIGRLIHDSYLYLGLNKTRAIREYALLAKLNSLGLPAPAPIACKISRHGLYYRADILSERITNANDVFTITQSQQLSEMLWQKIGATIANFHHYGIYHHDLNIHNILIDDQQKIWLIDFDQGEEREQGAWQQDNMSRLLRSFHKEKTKNPQMLWTEESWQPLLSGYQSAMTALAS